MTSRTRPRTADSLARSLAGAARRLRQAVDDVRQVDTPRDAVAWRLGAERSVDQQIQSVLHPGIAADGRFSWPDAWVQLFSQQALLDARLVDGLPLTANTVPAFPDSPDSVSPDSVSPDSGYAVLERRMAEINGLLATDTVSQVLDDLRSRFRTAAPEAYFHECFLARYAADGRRRQGAYYTPGPLIQFLVRGVDSLLRRLWDLPAGLATVQDSREPATEIPAPVLRIVDPACGTGTFLLGVLEHLDEHCDADQEAWRRVQRDLPRRLLGYELQPVAAITARHLFQQQLARICRRRGDPPPSWQSADRPWPVLLANALEQRSAWPNDAPGKNESRELRPTGSGRSEPGRDATCQRELMVILGNPPYGNFGRGNRFDWILGLLDDYKQGLQERKQNLDDDFVKFVRWAQYQVDRAGAGIVALVTSNTFLTGVTHRQMRRSLLDSFDQIYVLDLHGDTKRDSRGKGDERDENVFGIQQGVALSLMVKTGRPLVARGAFHAELWGSRSSKLDALQATDMAGLAWRPLDLDPPQLFFVPRTTRWADAYEPFPRLDQIFRHYVSGVQTKRDALLVDPSRTRLAARMRHWLSETNDGAAANAPFDVGHIRPYLVAPFDFRWVYFDPRLVGRARMRVMRHMRHSNLALVFMRQSTNPGAYDHFLATTELVSDRVFYSAHGAPFLAPLFLSDDPPGRANLSDDFLRQLSNCWRLPFDPLLDGQWKTDGHLLADGQRKTDGHLKASFGARDVFHYAYAIFHSPQYRRRLHERLRIEFPRLPLTPDLQLARSLCRQGQRLVAAHTLAAPAGTSRPTSPDDGGPRWTEDGAWSATPGFPRWEPFDADSLAESGDPCDLGLDDSAAATSSLTNGGRLVVDGRFCLNGVRREEWEFRLGGYVVLQRWLRSRRDTPLDASQRQYLAGLVRTVRQTCLATREIERLLEPWPWPDPPQEPCSAT